MSVVKFGEFVEGINYKVLNEREVRAGSGIMFLIGLVAFINGFILKNYVVLPYLSGFLLLSFLIASFVWFCYTWRLHLAFVSDAKFTFCLLK